jgi:hypothetical protein
MIIMTPWYTKLTGKTHPRITPTMLTSRAVAFDHNYADVLGNTELIEKTHPYTTLNILTSTAALDHEYDDAIGNTEQIGKHIFTRP